MKTQNILRLAALASTLLAAGAAKADLLFQDISTSPNHSVAVSIGGVGSTSGNVTAGLYHLYNDTTTSSFLAYCLEPLQEISAAMAALGTTPLDTGVNYASQAFNASSSGLPTGASYSSLINTLFNVYYNEAANDDQAAAFQLALWTLAYNAPSASYSALTYTNVTFANGSHNIVADAQAMLDGLANGTIHNHFVLTLWTNGASQDFLSATPESVPEPGVLALVGLAGLAAARRRRLV